MAATYKGLLTNNGKALIASATLNNKINYSHIAVGDGNGSVPNPLETRTALVNEKARIALNVVEINPNNTNQIICEAIIPSNLGGFYIRELGLYAGTTMIVNASYPPTYKPLVDEGGAREISIKLVINIQNAEVIALYLDDSLIYATRAWVDTNYIRRNEVVDNLTTEDVTKPVSAAQAKLLQDNKLDKDDLKDATVTQKGIVQLNNKLTSTSITEALTAAQGKVLNDQAFGVGQTWQVVTRLKDVVYTNPTAKSIIVFAYFTQTTANHNATLFCDGKIIDFLEMHGTGGATNTIKVISLRGEIPSGSQYEFKTNGTGVSIAYAAELR